MVVVYAIGAFSGLISAIKNLGLLPFLDYWWVYIIVFAIVVGIINGDIYLKKDKKKDLDYVFVWISHLCFCVVFF